MMSEQPKGKGGQNIARLLKAVPESLREAAARILTEEQAAAASRDPLELEQLSKHLLNILLQLLSAEAPSGAQADKQQARSPQGSEPTSGGSVGESGSGSPSQAQAGGGKPGGQPSQRGSPSQMSFSDGQGNSETKEEDGEPQNAETQKSGPEGQANGAGKSFSELVEELFGSENEQGDDADSEGESDDESEESDEETENKSKDSSTETPKADEEQSSKTDGGEAKSSESRSEGDPNAPAEPKKIPLTPEEEEELAARADLEAFLQVLEKVIKGRSKRPGIGRSRWVAWQPGDVFTEPEEILRYREDEVYSVPPEQRRAIHRRDKKLHLVVIAIDSSGSVNDALFSLLHTGMSVVADMLVEQEDVHLGVCQFSGGAQWTLPPTGDLMEVEWFSKQPATRLFNGGTTVSEVFAILGSEIAEYKSVDVVAMTDGYVEPGRQLAEKVDYYSAALGCEVKAHGVIYRGRGTTRNFEQAKELNPTAIRVWNIGKEPPKQDPAQQAQKQKQALHNLSPEKRDKLRQLRDKKRNESKGDTK